MPVAKPHRGLYVRAFLLLIAYLGLWGVGQLHALEHWDLNPLTHIHHTEAETSCPEDKHIPACQLCHSHTITTYSPPEVFRLSEPTPAVHSAGVEPIGAEVQGVHTLYLLRGPPPVC